MVELTKVREHLGRSDPALLFIGNNYVKTGTLANGRGRTNMAVVVVYDAPRNCQSQSRAFVLGFRMQPFKQIEDNIQIFLLDANAVIANIKLQVFRCALQGYGGLIDPFIVYFDLDRYFFTGKL